MPIFSNQSLDLGGGYEAISNRISALQSYNESRQLTQESDKKRGESLAQSIQALAGQKSSVEANQSRDKRNQPTSFDKLIQLINQSNPDSRFSNTGKEIRKNLLQLVFQMKGEINEIIQEEMFRTLNCAQEQTYKGLATTQIPTNQSLSLLPDQEGIYLNINYLDFNQSLKINPQSGIGRLYYETTGITTLSQYKNYPGNPPIPSPPQKPEKKPFPMNFELNQLIQNPGQTFKDEYSVFYNGRSRQQIFDIEYTTQNGVGATGNFFRVFLLDREGSPTSTNPGQATLQYSANTIQTAISDYFDSIELFSAKTFLASLLNLTTGLLASGVSIRQIENQNKFVTILNRIIGICEPGSSEIDVSGVAKVSELDNLDDTFFTFSEIELNDINQLSNNQKKGVIQYVDCDNIELPVNNEILLQELDQLSNTIDSLPVEDQVAEIERILDSIPQAWSQEGFGGVGFDLQNPFNADIIRNIILALASGLFTPKTILPLFVFIEYQREQIVGFANNLIVSGNTIITSANTLINSANTLNALASTTINDGVDFARKFRKFVTKVIGRIMNRFLELLFNMLKKNILKLLREIIRDIARTSKNAKLKAINAILNYAEPLVQGFLNYRECKSLIKQIQRILELIRGEVRTPPSPLPNALLVLSEFLPGISPERGVLNIIEYMQAYGLKTGPNPDGSPNRMVAFTTALQKGGYDEFVQNGKVEGTVFVPPFTGGVLKVFAKGK
jgi:hypothetical protein